MGSRSCVLALVHVLVLVSAAARVNTACVGGKSEFGKCVVESPRYTWHYKIGGGNITVRVDVTYQGSVAPWLGW